MHNRLILAATLLVFVLSHATSLQAQTGTQPTKGATKTATPNPGSRKYIRRPGSYGSGAARRGACKMSGTC